MGMVKGMNVEMVNAVEENGNIHTKIYQNVLRIIVIHHWYHVLMKEVVLRRSKGLFLCVRMKMAESALRMYLLMMFNEMRYLIYVIMMEFVLNYFIIWGI